MFWQVSVSYLNKCLFHSSAWGQLDTGQHASPDLWISNNTDPQLLLEDHVTRVFGCWISNFDSWIMYARVHKSLTSMWSVGLQNMSKPTLILCSSSRILLQAYMHIHFTVSTTPCSLISLGLACVFNIQEILSHRAWILHCRFDSRNSCMKQKYRTCLVINNKCKLLWLGIS